MAFQHVARMARRVLDSVGDPPHSLLFQQGMLVTVVSFAALLIHGEWLEELDMYCLNRIDLRNLSQDHQDWARCETTFYSTALQDKPLPQRFHPWLYNKLRRAVYVYAAFGLWLMSRAVWFIFQNERVEAALRDFQEHVHRDDKETRWGKRYMMAHMLLHNGTLGLYIRECAIAVFFLVVDTILIAFVLLTYNPWAIKIHIGDRNILDPNDLATTSFPTLTWCDVGQETGRLEGTYSYNCEVAANNTYQILMVFLAAALFVNLLKTVAAVVHCLLMANLPIWRQRVLGTQVVLPTSRTLDLYHLGHYTTLRGFRTAIREEVRERLDKVVLRQELHPATYHG